jgi:hypothetical protein
LLPHLLQSCLVFLLLLQLRCLLLVKLLLLLVKLPLFTPDEQSTNLALLRQFTYLVRLLCDYVELSFKNEFLLQFLSRETKFCLTPRLKPSSPPACPRVISKVAK